MPATSVCLIDEGGNRGYVIHALTAITQHDPNSTILSIDGIGAYDTVSRASMLRGLQRVPHANKCVPFARLWYAQPSEYVWHDQHGHPHTVTQAEGGEQGDPLMPVLFSLAQQPALQAVQTRLQPGESLYAFLDDVYAVAPPHRVRPIYDLLEHHLFAEARIRLNSGKTRVWNQGGTNHHTSAAWGKGCGLETTSPQQNNEASQS